MAADSTGAAAHTASPAKQQHSSTVDSSTTSTSASSTAAKSPAKPNDVNTSTTSNGNTIDSSFAANADQPSTATNNADDDASLAPDAKTALARQLFREGVDHLSKGGASSAQHACDALSRALPLYDALYAPMSLESAPVLTVYGRALLALHIAQTSVLGEILQERQAGVQAVGRGKGGLVGEDEDVGDSDDEKTEAQPATADNAKNDDDKANDAESDSDDDDEQDLHAASWEVLDLARVIYTKALDDNNTHLTSNERRRIELELAGVYEALADHCNEGEQFADAYAAYERALQLQSPYAVTDEYALAGDGSSLLRALAGLHSQMSVVCLYDGRATHALLHYREAQTMLRRRIDELQRRSSHGDDDEINECNDILDELSERVVGIVDKIREIAAQEKEEAKKSTDAQQLMSVPKMNFGFTSSSSTTSTAPNAASSSSNAFSSSSSSSAAAPVTVLGVKRKVQPSTSTSTTSTATFNNNAIDPRKKQKQ